MKNILLVLSIIITGFGYANSTTIQSSHGTTASGSPPTGTAGGDLTGTYPNPAIGAGKVIQADIANGAVGDAQSSESTAAIKSGKFGDSQLSFSSAAMQSGSKMGDAQVSISSNATNFTNQALLKTSTATFSGLTGVTDGSTAIAGEVGEIISTASANSVQLASSGVGQTIATMTITAGSWNINGGWQINFGATSAFTWMQACISLTAGSCDDGNFYDRVTFAVTPTVNNSMVIRVGPRRINTASATSYVFLVVTGGYTTLGGAVTSNSTGMIAERVR